MLDRILTLSCHRLGNDNPDSRCSAGDVSSVSKSNLSNHDGKESYAKYQAVSHGFNQVLTMG